MKKVFLTSAIAATAAACVYAPQAAAYYSDIPESYAYAETIQWISDKGVMNGYEDGTFKPSKYMTEAQFAIMLTRLIDLPAFEDAGHFGGERNFAYHYLANKGLVLKGYTNTRNEVRNRPFTRLEVAKAFYTIIHQTTPTDKQAIDWMYAQQLTTGKGVSKDKYVDFGSNDSLKRVHAAQFFRNFYKSTYVEQTSIAHKTYTKSDVEQLMRYADVAPVYADVNGDGKDELIMYHQINTYTDFEQSWYYSTFTDQYFAMYTYDETNGVYRFTDGGTLFSVKPEEMQVVSVAGNQQEQVLLRFTVDGSGALTAIGALTSNDGSTVTLSGAQDDEYYIAPTWSIKGSSIFVTEHNRYAETTTTYEYTFTNGHIVRKK